MTYIAPRVLFVTHSSRMGGAEFVLLDLLPAFSGRATVFLFEDGPLRGHLERMGIPILMARAGGGFRLIKRDRSLIRALPSIVALTRVAIEIAKAAKKHDVVYTNSQKAFVLSALSARWAGRPLAWHLHDILIPAHFGRSQIRLGIFLANRLAACVVVPSQAASHAFIAAGGRPDLLRVIPNGMDLVPTSESRLSLRLRLGLPTGFLIGVFSRLAPWKGQVIVLQALAALPGAKAIIAGDALFGEDAYARELRQVATQLGLEDRVLFVGHREDIPDLMRAVDVVVHPSIDPEPFGRTLVEAMLCGTPLIATAVGAASEILGETGQAGLLVAPGNPAILAEALQRLQTQPDLASRLVDAGQARAREMFNISDARKRVVRVVSEAAAT